MADEDKKRRGRAAKKGTRLKRKVYHREASTPGGRPLTRSGKAATKGTVETIVIRSDKHKGKPVTHKLRPGLQMRFVQKKPGDKGGDSWTIKEEKEVKRKRAPWTRMKGLTMVGGGGKK